MPKPFRPSQAHSELLAAGRRLAIEKSLMTQLANGPDVVLQAPKDHLFRHVLTVDDVLISYPDRKLHVIPAAVIGHTAFAATMAAPAAFREPGQSDTYHSYTELRTFNPGDFDMRGYDKPIANYTAIGLGSLAVDQGLEIVSHSKALSEALRSPKTIFDEIDFHV